MMRLCVTLVCAVALAGVAPGHAADEAGFPAMAVVADRLADRGERDGALLALAVLMRANRTNVGELSAEILASDLAWLQRLHARSGRPGPRPPALDPAGWLTALKVMRQALPPGSLIPPAPLDLDVSLELVFSRDQEQLASVMLPMLMWHMEAEASRFWQTLTNREEASNPDAQRFVEFAIMHFQGADEPLATGVDDVLAELDALVADAVGAGPPDPVRGSRLRRHLHLALAEQAGAAERVPLVAQLRLVALVEGLQASRITGFAEGLVAVAADLVRAGPERSRPMARWLERHLPTLSSAYAREFAQTDPGINAAVATVYDLALFLAADEGEGDAAVPVAGLADAVARLALLVPDINYYFDLPIRDAIAGDVEACLGMMARRDAEGLSAMTRELFDDCLASFVELADTVARAPGLAGDTDGPFGEDELQREVEATPAQRINYALGYLDARYETACSPPARPLPNPLEFATLATLLTWFGEQSPVYFQTPENEKRLERMRGIGNELIAGLAEQVDCIAGSGSGVNDPVTRVLADYRAELFEFNRLLRGVTRAFRDEVLAPGADIVLEMGVGQSTSYRPDDVVIGPCDPAKACEMTGTLGSTRALIGLFPEPYLIADQSGLGDIQLCYENVQWVDRRAEPVRPGDTNVANYFGHLSFDLKGRLQREAETIDVFGYRFRSPDEYHYLFAPANEEVLADPCPMEWVGTRIVTPMKRSRVGIVPNRLTYLAATRMLPSRLLAQNWDRGAEWRDWFITELGVEPLDPLTPPLIDEEVGEHLRSLYRREQATVYQRLLHGEAAGGAEDARRKLGALTTRKGLARMLIMLLYPQSLIQADAVRTGIAGQAGLLDEDVLQRLRQASVPVNSIGAIALERLDALQAAWREQPEAGLRLGSVSSSLALAMARLERVYRAYFAPQEAREINPAPPEPAGD